jgi:hypothetical protein
MWRVAGLVACGLLVGLATLLSPHRIETNETFPANNVYYIVIHHAASGAPDFQLDGGAGTPAHLIIPGQTARDNTRTKIITPLGMSLDISEQEIDTMHRARGFDEIGYNYVVRMDGTVEKGRAEDLRGAHAKQWDERGISYNASSIGICFAGNCNAARWTAAQQTAGYKLILELMRRYHVPPERVIGHRECGNDTDCPGLLIDMDRVREKLRRMENPIPVAEP